MARKSFVRTLTAEERQILHSLLEDPKEGYRARIILLSDEGLDAYEIEKALNVHHKTCLLWIRRFNQEGLAGIRLKPKGGSKPDFPGEVRERIVTIAKTSPRDLGLSFGTWSLRTLVWYLTRRERVVESISHETIRRILNEAGLRYRRSRKVLTSRDPEYELKKSESKGLSSGPHERGWSFSSMRKGRSSLKSMGAGDTVVKPPGSRQINPGGRRSTSLAVMTR